MGTVNARAGNYDRACRSASLKSETRSAEPQRDRQPTHVH